MSDYYAHLTAELDPQAKIGPRTKLWHNVQVREHSSIGSDCIISKGVYVDVGVTIGDKVKIQNYSCIYRGVTIEDQVFIGPHVCFTNDKLPRATGPSAEPKSVDDWQVGLTRIHLGASIGANCTILSGISIGQWSMVGAGTVVTKSIPPFALVYGNPGKVQGVVSPAGAVVANKYMTGYYTCTISGKSFEVLSEWVGPENTD